MSIEYDAHGQSRNLYQLYGFTVTATAQVFKTKLCTGGLITSVVTTRCSKFTPQIGACDKWAETWPQRKERKQNQFLYSNHTNLPPENNPMKMIALVKLALDFSIAMPCITWPVYHGVNISAKTISTSYHQLNLSTFFDHSSRETILWHRWQMMAIIGSSKQGCQCSDQASSFSEKQTAESECC